MLLQIPKKRMEEHPGLANVRLTTDVPAEAIIHQITENAEGRKYLYTSGLEVY